MAILQYVIFECSSPSCGLRFPSPTGLLNPALCPRCKGKLNQVDALEISQESENRPNALTGPLIQAILDNIRSAWNVGSMFRTADGMRLDHLYLCGITPTPSHPRVCRTALNAEKTVLWTYAPNAVSLAKTLLTEGKKLWVLEDAPAAVNLYDITPDDLQLPVALVVGNEIAGVDPGLIAMADRLLAIPMLGAKRSYNVAVAFGIAVSYLRYCQRVSQESFKILPNT